MAHRFNDLGHYSPRVPALTVLFIIYPPSSLKAGEQESCWNTTSCRLAGTSVHFQVDMGEPTVLA